MTTKPCPVCSRPMSPTVRGRQRVFCGKACRDAGWAARIVAHHCQVDPAAVWRLVHGQRVDATRAERVEATRQLRAQGATYRQVAELLHVTAKSVARYVVELKQRKVA